MNKLRLSVGCILSAALVIHLVNYFAHIELLGFLGSTMQLIGFIIALFDLRKPQK